jgi:XTP/dITP diphosphohydrolase
LTETKQTKKCTVIFATGNRHKLHEVQFILKNYPILIEPRHVKGLEIQSEDVEEIARTSVVWAVKKSKGPTFVEDAGLFVVAALKGFPGVFSSHAYKTIGNKGLLKLLDGVKNRKAVFKSAIAYSTPRRKPICFLGEAHGTIIHQEKGVLGFGFDPIFEPDGSEGKTFGEMDVDEKSRYSHRARAVRRFADWLLTHGVD